MKQLELDFNSVDLSDHYEAYRIIDEGKNQICSWSDSLSDDGKKIRYYNVFEVISKTIWHYLGSMALSMWNLGIMAPGTCLITGF